MDNQEPEYKLDQPLNLVLDGQAHLPRDKALENESTLSPDKITHTTSILGYSTMTLGCGTLATFPLKAPSKEKKTNSLL